MWVVSMYIGLVWAFQAETGAHLSTPAIERVSLESALKELQLSWELKRQQDQAAQMTASHDLETKIQANQNILNNMGNLLKWFLGGSALALLTTFFTWSGWFKRRVKAEIDQLIHTVRDDVFKDLVHLRQQVQSLKLEEFIKEHWSLLVIHSGDLSHAELCLQGQGFRRIETVAISTDGPAEEEPLPVDDREVDLVVFDNLPLEWINHLMRHGHQKAYAGYHTGKQLAEPDFKDILNLATSQIVLPIRVLETARFLSAYRRPTGVSQ